MASTFSQNFIRKRAHEAQGASTDLGRIFNR